jgi:hypothetical protein
MLLIAYRKESTLRLSVTVILLSPVPLSVPCPVAAAAVCADMHVDIRGNLAWVKNLSRANFKNDVILVAGTRPLHNFRLASLADNRCLKRMYLGCSLVAAALLPQKRELSHIAHYCELLRHSF